MSKLLKIKKRVKVVPQIQTVSVVGGMGEADRNLIQQQKDCWSSVRKCLILTSSMFNPRLCEFVQTLKTKFGRTMDLCRGYGRVIGTTSNQGEAALVFMPIDVVRVILQKLNDPSRNEAQLKILLNLREVSKITQGWIDKELQVREGQQLFASGQIHINMAEGVPGETLYRFLTHRPPRHIKALRLSGVENAAMTAKEFMIFRDYWTTDMNDQGKRHFVDSLEVDILNFQCWPLTAFLKGPLMGSLRKFRFRKMTNYEGDELKELLLSWSNLEELRVDFKFQQPHTLETLVTYLPSLKRLICVVGTAALPVVTNIVNSRKDDPEFQLRIIYSDLNENLSRDGINARAFLEAVEDSKSRTRLIAVESNFIWCFQTNWWITVWRGRLDKRQELWRELESLTVRENTLVFDFYSVGHLPKLKTLVFKDITQERRDGPYYFFRFCKFTFPSVTSLILDDITIRCDETVMKNIMKALDMAFPNLASLGMNWSWERRCKLHKMIRDEDNFLLDFQRVLRSGPRRCPIPNANYSNKGLHFFFGNLTSFKLKLDWENRVPDQLLRNVLRLQECPLRQLDLSVSPKFDREVNDGFKRLVNKKFLAGMLKGKICQTLERFTISHQLGKYAQPVWRRLQKSVEENYEKRVKSHGLQRGELI